MKDIEGFLSTVTKVWAHQWYGDPMAIFMRKLKEVKRELIVLNKTHGNVHNNVSLARILLSDIQDALAADSDNVELLQKEAEAIKHLECAILEEEDLLLQKSRVKWLNVGDGNTSFFFNQIRANWNKNKLVAFDNSNGDIFMGHKLVFQVAVDFFSSSLGEAHHLTAFDFDCISCASITPTQASLLEAPGSNSLILATLQGMKKNKASGPDGFTIEFFLATWDIVGNFFCDAVRSFFETSYMHKSVNATSIALIPKVASLQAFSRLRCVYGDVKVID